MQKPKGKEEKRSKPFQNHNDISTGQDHYIDSKKAIEEIKSLFSLEFSIMEKIGNTKPTEKQCKDVLVEMKEKMSIIRQKNEITLKEEKNQKFQRLRDTNSKTQNKNWFKSKKAHANNRIKEVGGIWSDSEGSDLSN